MSSAYSFSAYPSKQFTTAGADIDLVTSRPGFGTNANTQSPIKKGTRGLWITSASSNGNLVVEYEDGVTDTIEVVSGTMPYLLPVQAWKIKSTSTSGIKGNALY